MEKSSKQKASATDEAMEIEIDALQRHRHNIPTPQSSMSGSGPKSIIGSEDWHRERLASHKEVERRRRETINDGINELAKIVPGNEKNKGALLSRTAAYITELQSRVEQLSEQRSMEKHAPEQTINELMTQNLKYKKHIMSLESHNEAARQAERSILNSRLISLEKALNESMDRLREYEEQQISIPNLLRKFAHRLVDTSEGSRSIGAQTDSSGPTTAKKSANIEGEVSTKEGSSSDHLSETEREAYTEIDKTKGQIGTGGHLQAPCLSPSSDIHTPKSMMNATIDTDLSSSEGSDTSRISELDARTHGFVSSLSQRIVRSCLGFHLSRVRQHNEAPGGSSCASIQHLTGERQVKALSSTQKRRKRSKNEDDEQNQDSDEGPPGKKRTHVASDNKRFWACPYTKNDPSSNSISGELILSRQITVATATKALNRRASYVNTIG